MINNNRQASNRIPKIFPFLTSDDEIYPFFTGKTKGVPFQGGNASWITQNLTDERVITVWKATDRVTIQKWHLLVAFLLFVLSGLLINTSSP